MPGSRRVEETWDSLWGEPLEGAKALLEQAGYVSRCVPHYRTERYYMLQASAQQGDGFGASSRWA